MGGRPCQLQLEHLVRGASSSKGHIVSIAQGMSEPELEQANEMEIARQFHRVQSPCVENQESIGCMFFPEPMYSPRSLWSLVKDYC